MRALLLDTHVWLWLVDGNPQLKALSAWPNIELAGERSALAVSEVSFWEVAMKAAKGKLDVLPDPRAWLKRAARTPGIGVVQLDREILVDSAVLDMPVRDPADRMLVATALRYDLRLATADRNLLDYAAHNPDLNVLDCRNNGTS